MFYLDKESFKEAKLTFLLLIINVICFIVFNIILNVEYLLNFAQINSRVIENLELWRLFTSMFLHADILHIFSNMVALLLFGTAVENSFKRYQFLIIYFISGLIGNLFTLILLPPNVISLGASGAIFGLIGAAFVFFVKQDRSFILLGLIYIAYYIYSSFAPGINAIAHITGLAGGLLFGYLFKYVIIDKRSEDYYYPE